MNASLADGSAPTVARHAADTRTDRERLSTAFRALRRLGYVAYVSTSEPPTDAYDTKCVYWYKAQDRAFVGYNLYGPLDLHWQGDIVEIVQALRFEGIRALMPERIHGTLRLLPHESSVHRFLVQPGAIAARDYHRPCYVCGKSYAAHIQKRKRAKLD